VPGCDPIRRTGYVVGKRSFHWSRSVLHAQLDQEEYQRVLAAEPRQAIVGLSYCRFNISSMVTISTNPEQP
jgi:hypothetical protein